MRRCRFSGMAGDQQAATVGQGLHQARHGEGDLWHGLLCAAEHRQHRRAFAHSGCSPPSPISSTAGATYALEGSIFIAGAAVQWLRDGLNLIAKSSDVEQVAAQAKPDHGVYMVPAFVGLGAPYWDAGARGAILGLTRDSGPAEIAAATLDSVCYQTRDLVEAMRGDGAQIDELRVDGGMVVNDPLMQRLADTVGRAGRAAQGDRDHGPGRRLPGRPEGGPVALAGGPVAKPGRSTGLLRPAEDTASRDRRYAGWKDAVRRVRSSWSRQFPIAAPGRGLRVAPAMKTRANPVYCGVDTIDLAHATKLIQSDCRRAEAGRRRHQARAGVLPGPRRARRALCLSDAGAGDGCGLLPRSQAARHSQHRGRRHPRRGRAGAHLHHHPCRAAAAR